MPTERQRAMQIEREFQRLLNDLSLQDEELDLLSSRFEGSPSSRTSIRRTRSVSLTSALRV